MLSPASGFGGNGTAVPCYHGCGTRVTSGTMHVDRYPVCGHDGGRYTRGNIVPSCRSCNATRCDGCMGVVAGNGGVHDREVGYVDTDEPWRASDHPLPNDGVDGDDGAT